MLNPSTSVWATGILAAVPNAFPSSLILEKPLSLSFTPCALLQSINPCWVVVDEVQVQAFEAGNRVLTLVCTGLGAQCMEEERDGVG